MCAPGKESVLHQCPRLVSLYLSAQLWQTQLNSYHRAGQNSFDSLRQGLNRNLRIQVLTLPSRVNQEIAIDLIKNYDTLGADVVIHLAQIRECAALRVILNHKVMRSEKFPV